MASASRAATLLPPQVEADARGQLLEQGFLVLEVPVEETLGHARRPDDVDHPGLGVAPLREQLGGPVEELLLALQALGGEPPVGFHRARACPTLDPWVNARDPVVPSTAMAAGTRQERLADRERNPKWKNPPLLIDMSICINCDTCIRHCPPQFGAIFNHGMDVIIIPELCSGCDKCLDPCPVDCIYPDPDWTPSGDDWWQEPATDDPYRSRRRSPAASSSRPPAL